MKIELSELFYFEYTELMQRRCRMADESTLHEWKMKKTKW